MAGARRYKDEAILVLLKGTEQQVRLDLSSAGFAMPKVGVLLTSFHKPLPAASEYVPMEPYSAFIAKITK